MSNQVPIFHGFIGQGRLIRKVRRLAKGASTLKKPFPNLILAGPSGMGKTVLAKAIAAEFGTKLHEVISSRRIGAIDLALRLSKVEKWDFIFFDEIHSLRGEIQELLYRVISASKAPNVVEEPPRKPRIFGEVDIPPITVLGATDQLEGLLPAFLKRFGEPLVLRPYNLPVMRKIVDQYASSLQIALTPQASRLVASVCRGVPRVAENLLEHLNLNGASTGRSKFLEGHVRQFLKGEGIDSRGLREIERLYLKCLTQSNAPVPMRGLQSKLGVGEAHILMHVEPWLQSQGLVDVMSRGRILTALGKEIMKDFAEKG